MHIWCTAIHTHLLLPSLYICLFSLSFPLPTFPFFCPHCHSSQFSLCFVYMYSFLLLSSTSLLFPVWLNHYFYWRWHLCYVRRMKNLKWEEKCWVLTREKTREAFRKERRRSWKGPNKRQAVEKWKEQRRRAHRGLWELTCCLAM